MPSSRFGMRRCGATIEEHWTVSRRSVVLSGSHECLWEVADQLDVARDRVIAMTPTRAVLALWGAPLVAYQQRIHSESSMDELLHPD